LEIMKKLLLTVAAVCSAFALTAQARTSSPGEIAGYNTCLEAGHEQLDGLALSRTFFVGESADSHVFYINGTAWDGGDRIKVRITCDTSKNGRQLLSIHTGEGRFAKDHSNGHLQVAGIQ
jgi:hypothetical protein